MIQMNNLSKWYGNFQVLKNCTTELARGEVVVVCGPSGSGKSTLIKCVNGLEPVQEGDIFIENQPVTGKGVDLPTLRAKVGMVFQHFELFPHLSIIDNLNLAQIKVLGRDHHAATKKGMALLERVGLKSHAHKYPIQLSGGQQQRVAIVRAIATNPELLLLDEITSALDPQLVAEVLDLVRELKSDGTTIVMATHEMAFARDVADRVVFLDGGVIVEQGPAAEVFSRPREERTRAFLRRFLGPA